MSKTDPGFKLIEKLDDIGFLPLIHGYQLNMDRYSKRLATRDCAKVFCDNYMHAFFNYREYIAKESNNRLRLVLNFKQVDRLSPGWCNEFCGYIAQRTDWSLADFLYYIQYLNMSYVKHGTMMTELLCVLNIKDTSQ